MIAHLKPYAEYKESGLLWLGDIPLHWEPTPNRAHLRIRKLPVGQRHPEYQLLSLTKRGVIVRDLSENRGKFSSDMGTSQEVRVGDLVFCLFDVPETPRTVGLSRHAGMITGAYTVMECADPKIARFFEAFYIAMDDRKLLSPLYSGLRNTIPKVRFLGAKTPLPPPDEQAAIVRFLDWANGRLERAIRAKRKVIALLNEQKQAIIHRAVTRGLDPSVPLKPSGIPWLGDIPQHWECAIKMKYISSLKGRLGWQGLQAHEYSDHGPAVVSSAHFRNQKINWDKCPHVSQERYEMDANIQLAEGDILLMKDGAAMGKLALVGELPTPACLNSHLLLFRPLATNGGPKYDPKFMFYFMQTSFFQDYVQVNGTGATFLGVSQDALGNYKICLPSIDEQRAIVRFLDGATRFQDEALALVDQEITLLREYRTRLVADVVTGKLDVREAAAQLPAGDGEDEATLEELSEGDAAEDIPVGEESTA